MPIFTSVPIQVFDQESFHAIDKIVTGCAFDIHNEMGRYLDERLYQVEMAARLQHQKLDSVREVKITVALEDFTRFYYLDVLISGGVIVEIKTAETLTAAHRAQVLNYLYLCGLHHATLLNFRTGRVQHEFISTNLSPGVAPRDIMGPQGLETSLCRVRNPSWYIAACPCRLGQRP